MTTRDPKTEQEWEAFRFPSRPAHAWPQEAPPLPPASPVALEEPLPTFPSRAMVAPPVAEEEGKGDGDGEGGEEGSGGSGGGPGFRNEPDAAQLAEWGGWEFSEEGNALIHRSLRKRVRLSNLDDAEKIMRMIAVLEDRADLDPTSFVRALEVAARKHYQKSLVVVLREHPEGARLHWGQEMAEAVLPPQPVPAEVPPVLPISAETPSSTEESPAEAPLQLPTESVPPTPSVEEPLAEPAEGLPAVDPETWALVIEVPDEAQAAPDVSNSEPLSAPPNEPSSSEPVAAVIVDEAGPPEDAHPVLPEVLGDAEAVEVPAAEGWVEAVQVVVAAIAPEEESALEGGQAEPLPLADAIDDHPVAGLAALDGLDYVEPEGTSESHVLEMPEATPASPSASEDIPPATETPADEPMAEEVPPDWGDLGEMATPMTETPAPKKRRASSSAPRKAPVRTPPTTTRRPAPKTRR